MGGVGSNQYQSKPGGRMRGRERGRRNPINAHFHGSTVAQRAIAKGIRKPSAFKMGRIADQLRIKRGTKRAILLRGLGM